MGNIKKPRPRKKAGGGFLGSYIKDAKESDVNQEAMIEARANRKYPVQIVKDLGIKNNRDYMDPKKKALEEPPL